MESGPTGFFAPCGAGDSRTEQREHGQGRDDGWHNRLSGDRKKEKDPVEWWKEKELPHQKGKAADFVIDAHRRVVGSLQRAVESPPRGTC
jgi:hypothetical protein